MAPPSLPLGVCCYVDHIAAVLVLRLLHYPPHFVPVRITPVLVSNIDAARDDAIVYIIKIKIHSSCEIEYCYI